MRSGSELAYSFPSVEAAAAFAAALRGGDPAAPGSLHGLLDETCSELERVARRKRVVEVGLVTSDDGCHHAREAALVAGRERGEVEDEIWAALEALVAKHGGTKWRPGFEALEANRPGLARLRDAGATAFMVLEAPPRIFEERFGGGAASIYGDRARSMALLDSPHELRLQGRWRLLREDEELGAWSGDLRASVLTLDRSEEGPGWKPGDLVAYDAPPPTPAPDGLLARLKRLLGG